MSKYFQSCLLQICCMLKRVKPPCCGFSITDYYDISMKQITSLEQVIYFRFVPTFPTANVLTYQLSPIILSHLKLTCIFYTVQKINNLHKTTCTCSVLFHCDLFQKSCFILFETHTYSRKYLFLSFLFSVNIYMEKKCFFNCV